MSGGLINLCCAHYLGLVFLGVLGDMQVVPLSSITYPNALFYNDGAQRLPQIFNLQLKIFNTGGPAGLGFFQYRIHPLQGSDHVGETGGR